MSTVASKRMDHRPYTVGTFQKRLNDFEDFIKEITLQDVEATPEERRQMITENLRYDQFCDSIRALFGEDIRNQDLKSIYRKISTNPDARVDWSELFGYFQSGDDEQDLAVGEDVSVFMVSARRRVGDAAGDRKRRDTVQSIQYITSMDCYLTASQKGAISIWTSKLRLQSCTDINESAWVTGCDYLPVLRRVACCTERSIAVWDNRAKGKAQQVFTVKPIEHSPQCMTWIPRSQSPQEDCLLFGDDQGYVNLLTVCAKDLTMKNSKGDQRYTQNFAIEPKKLSIPIERRRLHDDWVLKIKYFPDLRCFASCSPSSTASFVLEEVDRILDQGEVRGVSIPKGVNAFAYCVRANIIATGGVDKVIRVWHPHIFSRPTGKLIGHLFTIVDIECNEKDQHIISLSTARVFRVWDIHTLTSLQVFTDNEERPGEKRIYSILFDNRHDRLLSGSSVLDAWPLTRAVQDTMQVPHTHDRPINQVLFNKELNQIVTVCSGSVVRVWEVETGRQVYQITEAHGPNIEVTALTLDTAGYRLASGAFDGSVKVWDFGSGQEIKVKAGKGAVADEDLSVLGLRYVTCENQRCILAIGWNNHIRVMLDSNENYDLQEVREYSDLYNMRRHIAGSPVEGNPFRQAPLPNIGGTDAINKEYVLKTHEMTCLAFLTSGHLAATGCSNGNLLLWDTVQTSVDNLFELPQSVVSTSRDSGPPNSGRRRAESNTAVNVIQFFLHKTRKLDPSFIRKLTHHGFEESDEEVTKDADPDTSRSTSQITISQVENDKESDHEERDGQDNRDNNKDDQGDMGDHENGMSPERRRRRSGEREEEEEEKENSDEDEDEDFTDPDAKMIVETFDPVLVSCHHDSFVRFWSLQGELLREITAMTRRQGSPVTALCHDDDCNLMVTGDQKGYITLWDVGKFLENPHSEKKELIKQVLCWRAHLTKVSHLVYVDALKAIVSGSTDGSVRVWWGTKGRFVGFYSQHRPFQWPTSEETSGTPVLPYDINEGPLAPVKTVSARQKIRATQKFEYPLMFNNDSWQTFRRSAYIRQKGKRQEPEEKKFFGALIKPRAYNSHLECSRSGEMRQGAVFRALPIYTVKTPTEPRTPEIGYPRAEEDTPLHLLVANEANQQAKAAKVEPKNTKEPKEKVKGNKKSKSLGVHNQPVTSPDGSPRRR